MQLYALVQPPGVLHLVPAEPPKDLKLLRLSQRFGLRNEYVKNMLGLDGKRARPDHNSWQKLDNVRWLEHVTTGDLVPIVGEIKKFLSTAHAPKDDICFDERARCSSSSRRVASSTAAAPPTLRTRACTTTSDRGSPNWSPC